MKIFTNLSVPWAVLLAVGFAAASDADAGGLRDFPPFESCIGIPQGYPGACKPLNPEPDRNTRLWHELQQQLREIDPQEERHKEMMDRLQSIDDAIRWPR